MVLSLIRSWPAKLIMTLTLLVWIQSAAGFAYHVCCDDNDPNAEPVPTTSVSPTSYPVIWRDSQVLFYVTLPETFLPDFHEAVADYNAIGADVTLATQEVTDADPCNQSDGRNSMTLLANRDCEGGTFGEVLGATLITFESIRLQDPDNDNAIKPTWKIRETDIYIRSDVNSQNASLSCRGDRSFYCVSLHELGHALGLLHPSDYRQGVSAIMNSPSTGAMLQNDDINGILFLYGGGENLIVLDPLPVKKNDSGLGVLDGGALLAVFVLLVLTRRLRARR